LNGRHCAAGQVGVEVRHIHNALSSRGLEERAAPQLLSIHRIALPLSLSLSICVVLVIRSLVFYLTKQNSVRAVNCFPQQKRDMSS